jgi:predicted aspartyl protease
MAGGPRITGVSPSLPTAAALLVLWPGAARPDTGTAPPAPQSLEEVVVSAPEPRFVAPTTRDRIGRIWTPVLINGKGPYRLVLDTGASRSAVIQRIVDDLQLPVRAEGVRLRGVTGTAMVSAVDVQTMEFGELLVEDTRMPIVADVFGGADGVLGGEGLEDKRIAIEFGRDRISIVRSNRAKGPTEYSVVPFKYSPARGMRASVMVGNVKATALIDTGAQRTVGNLALREALARHRGERDDYEEAIIGVTEDIQQATRVRIPSIVAGQLIVRDAEIMFSDLYIFEHWKLDSKPALLIGMDVLGMLDTLIIDYGRSELQIRTRH